MLLVHFVFRQNHRGLQSLALAERDIVLEQEGLYRVVATAENVVNEGEITNVEILPGGNILVTGSKSSKYSTSDIYDINKYNTTKTYMLEFDKTVTGETQTLLSYVADTDYTIKVKLRNLTASNDGFAGVMVGEDTNNMVFAGKMMIENAEYLVLGERIDGAFNIHEKINNIDTEDVIVQLQKCGMEYSAVYSVDGGVTWLVIGDDIKCNYSVIKTGLYVGANTTVNVTYITYGDYIHDNNTINTPCYPDERDCSFIQNYKNISKLTYKSTSIDATNITLNDTPQQLLFTTDLGTKDYYMSFEVSNNGATIFDILCRGNEQGYVALRLTDGMVQAVENGAVTRSQEIIGMSLAKIKKVALKATATGIILWIDEVPIALPTDFFNTRR